MRLEVKPFTRERIPDVLDFEKHLREEEPFYGWDIGENYICAVERSFDDPAFDTSLSLLAYADGKVVGRVDSTMIATHFDGSKKAYLDWICVLKSHRHHGVAQSLLRELLRILRQRNIGTLIALTAANEEAQRFYKSIPNAVMRDVGIWIDVIPQSHMSEASQ